MNPQPLKVRTNGEKGLSALVKKKPVGQGPIWLFDLKGTLGRLFQIYLRGFEGLCRCKRNGKNITAVSNGASLKI